MQRQERIATKPSTWLLFFVLLMAPGLFLLDVTAMTTWWVARLPREPGKKDRWRLAAARIAIAMLFLKTGYRL